MLKCVIFLENMQQYQLDCTQIFLSQRIHILYSAQFALGIKSLIFKYIMYIIVCSFYSYSCHKFCYKFGTKDFLKRLKFLCSIRQGMFFNSDHKL